MREGNARRMHPGFERPPVACCNVLGHPHLTLGRRRQQQQRQQPPTPGQHVRWSPTAGSHTGTLTEAAKGASSAAPRAAPVANSPVSTRPG